MLKWIKEHTNFVNTTNTTAALRRYVEIEFRATGDRADFLVAQLQRGQDIR